MIYGLLAAIGWGTSAAAATVAVRRARTYLVVLVSQGLGLAALVLLAIVLHRTLPIITGPVALGLAGAGLIGLVGYLTFYRSVAVGPAGLMSAISSTYGGVAAGLAVGLLGEHLGAVGIAGILLAVCGVALAAANGPAQTADQVGTGTVTAGLMPFSPAAIPLALGSAISYGVSGFMLGYFTRQSGWLLACVIAHGASVTALLAALPILGGRGSGDQGSGERGSGERGTGERGSGGRKAGGGQGDDSGRSQDDSDARARRHRLSPHRLRGGTVLIWAAAAGLTDAVGVAAFSRGSQLGQVAITAATSSVYPVIPLIVGVVLLGERLRRRQLGGTVLIIAGLVLLGLA